MLQQGMQSTAWACAPAVSNPEQRQWHPLHQSAPASAPRPSKTCFFVLA